MHDVDKKIYVKYGLLVPFTLGETLLSLKLYFKATL